MIVAGVDAGAATTKALILRDGEILSYTILPTGHKVAETSEQVTQEALKRAQLSMSDLDYVVSTGYGRKAIPFAHKAITEIICHAKGANFLIPETRGIIDIGGQDSKVISVDERGNVTDFVMNDKCAAGTGRFLEVMANVLGVELDELGLVSLTSKSPCQISNTCTIFAESEVVSLRAEGRSRADLVAGIHKAVASRVAIMASNIRLEKETVFTGGVAKNVGVRRVLEEEIGLGILVPEEPQIIGALGAALLANQELSRGNLSP